MEEIEKGEIPDISKELEVVRADEVKFTKKAAEPKPPRPNPIELTRLLADTPPKRLQILLFQMKPWLSMNKAPTRILFQNQGL